jgi:hypothetical protein
MSGQDGPPAWIWQRTSGHERITKANSRSLIRDQHRRGDALITVEMASPEIAGKHRFSELGISHHRFLPGVAVVVDRATAGGRRRRTILASSPSKSALVGG